MPEGDTIHHAANRIRPLLEGGVPEEIRTPHPRHGRDRWPERLAGRGVTGVGAHGKHLFLRFEGGLTLHSHLRMTGRWDVYPEDRRWGRAAHRAWLVIRARGHEVVEFDGPVLELMTESRTRFDQRLAALGPDILAPDFDSSLYVRRLRAEDPARTVGDALLDQRIVAGIGNMWKAEACWHAAVDPWRTLAALADEEAVSLVEAIRPLMLVSARDGHQSRTRRVYDRAGQPCPRCATKIGARKQGDDARTTFWCSGCQR